MTARSPLAVILLTLAIAAWPSLAGSTSANDAGSGSDAGNSPANALRIPGDGSYEGSAAGADRDWFWTPASGSPVCAVLDVSTFASREATLAFTNSGSIRYVRTTVDESHSRLVLAGPDVARTYVAITGAEAPAYEFHLTTYVAQGDGAVDTGAPVWLSGPCIGGSLSGPGAVDRYLLGGTAGDSVDVSLAGTHGSVTGVLRDPAGTVLGQVASGGAATFALPMSGTYTFELTSSTAASYVAGIVLGDPGPQPCRPNCVSFADL